MTLTRRGLKQLAEARVRDAEVLLKGRRYAAAYYLCGYAVECALKACIAKQTVRHEFPDLKRVRDSYTHNIRQLIVEAGLIDDLNTRLKIDGFERNWTILQGWSEEKRYEYPIMREQAQDLYTAVTDNTDGVLTWLMNYW